jgi:hypothetical protein
LWIFSEKRVNDALRNNLLSALFSDFRWDSAGTNWHGKAETKPRYSAAARIAAV